MTIFFTLATLFLSLAGCGGREVQAVRETSELDSVLSCAHIRGEISANQARMAELMGERDRGQRDSALRVLAGGPASLLFLDVGESQRIEHQALVSRNMRLASLAEGRGCS